MVEKTAGDLGKVSFEVNGIDTIVSNEEMSTLLDLALKNRISCPYSCLEGVCLTCKTQLLSGKVRGELMQGNNGEVFVLACQTFALGDVKLRVISKPN